MTDPRETTDERVTLATVRARRTETVVLRDRLPPLREGEIRMHVDKVGLSANNVFYAQMGAVPGLRFFAAYPVTGRDDLVHVPAWGVATVIASRNPDFRVGERFRGFLHLANLVQLEARRSGDGFVGAAAHRRALLKPYNTFVAVDAATSVLGGEGAEADLAASSAPSAMSGYLLAELLLLQDFYGCRRVALTSASSKISLSAAVTLADARREGRLRSLVGYTSRAHADFVRSTGLYDEVLTYEESLSAPADERFVLADVAGDATLLRKNGGKLRKTLAVGGTHTRAAASTFTTFGPSSLAKLGAEMAGAERIAQGVERLFAPPVEMFFAPTVMTQLLRNLGREEFDRRCDAALRRFAHAAVEGGFIHVLRCEEPTAVQAAYRRVFEGRVSPSEALLVAL